MYNEYEEAKRSVVKAILNRYHQTRLAGDAIEFILADEEVQDTFECYALMYASG